MVQGVRGSGVEGIGCATVRRLPGWTLELRRRVPGRVRVKPVDSAPLTGSPRSGSWHIPMPFPITRGRYRCANLTFL